MNTDRAAYGSTAMPIHDWTRVNAGLFHHFDQSWIVSLSSALNAGALPSGYYALAEQRSEGLIPDVLTLQLEPRQGRTPEAGGGLAVAESPPRAWLVRRSEPEVYAERADRIAIRHSFGELVAIIEIVSPGNKATKYALKGFVDKALEFLRKGVHLLVVDLFPPGPRDPQGLHPAI